MFCQIKSLLIGSLFAAVYFTSADINQVSARVADTRGSTYYDRGYSDDGWRDGGYDRGPGIYGGVDAGPGVYAGFNQGPGFYAGFDGQGYGDQGYYSPEGSSYGESYYSSPQYMGGHEHYFVHPQRMDNRRMDDRGYDQQRQFSSPSTQPSNVSQNPNPSAPSPMQQKR